MTLQEARQLLVSSFSVFQETVREPSSSFDDELDLEDYLAQRHAVEQADKFKGLFDDVHVGDERFIHTLENLLTDNWGFIQGSCLSYTSMHNTPLTRFFVEIACSLAQLNRVSDVGGSGADGKRHKTWLDYLMPGVEADWIDDNPADVDACLNQLGRCILSEDGGQLICVLDEENNHREFTSNEAERLACHNEATRWLAEICETEDALARGETDILSAFNRLIEGLKKIDPGHDNNLIYQSHPTRFMPAVTMFMLFWGCLAKEQQKTILETLPAYFKDNILDGLHYSFNNKTLSDSKLSSNIFTLSYFVERYAHLSDIHLDEHATAYLQRKISDNRQDHWQSISQKNYQGKDNLMLTTVIIQHFSLLESIANQYKNNSLVFILKKTWINHENYSQIHQWLNLFVAFVKSERCEEQHLSEGASGHMTVFYVCLRNHTLTKAIMSRFCQDSHFFIKKMGLKTTMMPLLFNGIASPRVLLLLLNNPYFDIDNIVTSIQDANIRNEVVNAFIHSIGSLVTVSFVLQLLPTGNFDSLLNLQSSDSNTLLSSLIHRRKLNKNNNFLIDIAIDVTLDRIAKNPDALLMQDNDGYHALHIAAQRGNRHAVDRILAINNTGEFVNMKSEHGLTPTLLALDNEYYHIANMINPDYQVTLDDLHGLLSLKQGGISIAVSDKDNLNVVLTNNDQNMWHEQFKVFLQEHPILDDLGAPFFDALCCLLEERWKQIKQTCLGYTSMPNLPINRFFIFLAKCLATLQKDYGAGGSQGSPDKTWLEFLMPGIDVADTQYWGDILDRYPAVFQQCVLSEDGETLIPVEIINYAGDIRSFSCKNIERPYGPGGCQLTDDEIQRLRNHSNETQALVQAHKTMVAIDEEGQNLGAALGRLMAGLRAGSSHGDGSGGLDKGGEGIEANLAIRDFFVFFERLTEQQQAKARAMGAGDGLNTLGQLLNMLVNPADNPNCIWITATSIVALLKAKPELYEIQLGDEEASLTIGELDKTFETNRKALQGDNYRGVDRQPLTPALIEQLDMLALIRDEAFPLNYLIEKITHSQQDKAYWLALLDAYLQSDACSVEILKAKNIGVLNRSAFIFACEQQLTQVAQLILNSKYCCEEVLCQQDNDGYSGLHFAAKFGYEDIIQLVLDSKHVTKRVLTEDTKVESETPLNLASKNGHTKAMFMLCKPTVNFFALVDKVNFRLTLREGEAVCGTDFLGYALNSHDISIIFTLANIYSEATIFQTLQQHRLDDINIDIQHALYDALIKKVFKHAPHGSASCDGLNFLMEKWPLSLEHIASLVRISACKLIDGLNDNRVSTEQNNDLGTYFTLILFQRVTDQLNGIIEEYQENSEGFLMAAMGFYHALWQTDNFMFEGSSATDFCSTFNDDLFFYPIRLMAWFISKAGIISPLSNQIDVDGSRYWYHVAFPAITAKDWDDAGVYSIKEIVRMDDGTIIPIRAVKKIGDVESFSLSNITIPSGSDDGERSLSKRELSHLFRSEVFIRSLFCVTKAIKAVKKRKVDLISALSRLEKDLNRFVYSDESIGLFVTYFSQFDKDAIERKHPIVIELIDFIKRHKYDHPTQCRAQINYLLRYCQNHDDLSTLSLNEEQMDNYLRKLGELFDEYKSLIGDDFSRTHYIHLSREIIDKYRLLDFVERQENPLHYIITPQDCSYFVMFGQPILFAQFLDERGSEEMLRQPNDELLTPLMLAAREGDLDIIEVIIQSPWCDLDLLEAQTPEGATAASLAEEAGFYGIAEAIAVAISNAPKHRSFRL